jgi:hypothetical protein
MPPRKSEEIPVAVREKVIEAYKTKKNIAEHARILRILTKTIGSNEKNLKFMKVLTIDVDLGCTTNSNVQGG